MEKETNIPILDLDKLDIERQKTMQNIVDGCVVGVEMGNVTFGNVMEVIGTVVVEDCVLYKDMIFSNLLKEIGGCEDLDLVSKSIVLSIVEKHSKRDIEKAGIGTLGNFCDMFDKAWYGESFTIEESDEEVDYFFTGKIT